MNAMIANYQSLLSSIPEAVTLVAVSKTKPVEMIMDIYSAGQRDFGENYVQELMAKYPLLPNDIRWHFIGHLQTNKVKFIVPLVYLIHGVDSLKLLAEINKQSEKTGKITNVLLQVHIASEETKFGLNEEELDQLLQSPAVAEMKNICIRGLMGMASFTDDKIIVRKEFHTIKTMFDSMKNYTLENLSPEILSIGMSGDYQLAIEEGSTMVRIGSTIFGSRN